MQTFSPSRTRPATIPAAQNSGGKSNTSFTDNRPEAVFQRKVQQMIRNGTAQRTILGTKGENIWSTQIGAAVYEEQDRTLAMAIHILHGIDEEISVKDYEDLVTRIKLGEFNNQLKQKRDKKKKPTQITIKDCDVTPDEIWEEVSDELFYHGKISKKYEKDARAIFDRLLPLEYDYYEDVAEQVEIRLCYQLKVPYPMSVKEAPEEETQKGGSGGLLGGGWFGPLMKIVVSYLVLSEMVPKVQAFPTFQPKCNINALTSDICSDDMGTTALSFVRCMPEVSDLCTKTRENPIYDGLIRDVDTVCRNITISGPSSKDGACVFVSSSQSGEGSVSCKALSSYTPTQIGHELEHARDSCRLQSIGDVLSRNQNGIDSEIHAHTVQAAIAKVRIMRGQDVSTRDRALVQDFDNGCPLPKDMSAIDNVEGGFFTNIHIYHKLYLGKSLSLKELNKKYERKVDAAVLRYKEMIKTQDYVKSK